MKQKLLLLLFSSVTFITSNAQTDSWITLKYPQGGILGNVVRNINNGDLDYDPNTMLTVNSYTSYQSADYLYDFKESYRKFFMKFFNKEKFSVNEVEIKKLQMKSIPINDASNMNTQLSYVYQGLAADTFELTITRKKEVNIDFSKAIKTVLEVVSKEISNPTVTEKMDNFFKIVDSTKSERKDSLLYKLKIYSPNVFFKVKIVRYKQLTKIDWDKYFYYFQDGTKKLCKSDKKRVAPRTVDLKNKNRENETASRYPEFWGNKDLKSVRVKIGMKKENGELKLFAYFTENKAVANKSQPTTNWKAIELPFEIGDDNKRFWNIDRLFIYSFYHNGVDKQVFVSISADQIDNDTIRITHWDGEDCNRTKRTFMQYPEVQLEYVTK